MTLIHENEQEILINPATKLVIPHQRHHNLGPGAAERRAEFRKGLTINENDRRKSVIEFMKVDFKNNLIF